jgi:hypothetical protein
MLRYFNTAISTLLLSSVTIFTTEGQQVSYTDFSARLKKYCEAVPWEEVYVHTDRSDYIAGEEIWFSIYSIDRASGLLSGRSRVVYFELLNQWNVPVVQKSFLLQNGNAPGNAWLMDTLSSGTYTLRAYTNWMKNFLPENCFMSRIDIYNPFKTKPFVSKIIAKEHSPDPVNIKFYPEGGMLVNGAKCRVAVRVADKYSRGLIYSGIVRRSDGDSIAAFKTDKSGFGSFGFTPLRGEKYYISEPGRKIPLPATREDGISLYADITESGSLEVTYSANGSYARPSPGTLSLLVINKGHISFVTSLNPGNVSNRLTVPANLIATGISHLVIFENYSRAVCERIFYKPGNNKPDMIINMPSEAGRREKVDIEIKMASAAVSDPLKLTGVSVSVIPEAYSDHLPSIDDFMIFGSEFGVLPWVDSDGGLSDIDLSTIDNYLISAKSFWLDWERIIGEEEFKPVYRFETEGHYLSGYLKMRDPVALDTSRLLYLNISGKAADLRYARTDNTGRFDFLLPADSYLRRLVIQPEQEDENLVLSLDQPFSWKLPASYSFVDSSSQGKPERFSRLSFNYQTGRIYNTLSRSAQVKPEYAPSTGSRFYGIPELEILMDDYIQLPVMKEVFFELVPGVRFRERRDGYEMRIINPFSNFFYESPPLVMIDGIYMSDLSKIAEMDPELVERIDITRTTYLIGDLLLHGIVNVVTRKGNLGNISLPDHVVEMSYSAFDKPVSIVLPDYSDIKKLKSKIPDFRNTLYWNPSFNSKSAVISKLDFWTSDIPGDYIIDIEGITENGEMVSIKRILTVR